MSVNAKNWQELKKPNGLEKKPGGDPKRKSTFVALTLRAFARAYASCGGRARPLIRSSTTER